MCGSWVARALFGNFRKTLSEGTDETDETPCHALRHGPDFRPMLIKVGIANVMGDAGRALCRLLTGGWQGEGVNLRMKFVSSLA